MSHGSATIAVDGVRRVDSVGGSSTGRPPSSSSYPDHRGQKQNLLLTSDNAKEELHMALQKAQYKLMRAIASVHSSFEELFELSLCCSVGSSGLGNNTNENTNSRSEEPEVHHQGGLDYFSSIIAQPLAVGSMLTANALKVAKERFQEVEVALAEAEQKIEQRTPAASIQEFAGKQRGMILQQAVALQHDQLACLLENLSSVLRPAGTTPGAAGGHRHTRIFEEKEASQQQAPDPMAGVHSPPSHHPQSNGVHDQSAPWDSTSSTMRDVVTGGGGSIGGAPPPFDLHQPRTAGGGFGPNTVPGPHHQRSGSNSTTAAAATYSKPTNGGGHIPSTVHNRHHQQQPLATTSSPQSNGNPAGFVDLGSSVFDNSANSHDASGHTPPTPQLHPASVSGASHYLTPPHASPSLIPHNVSTYSAASSMVGANASNTSYPGGAAPSSSTNHHAGSNGYAEPSGGLHLPPRSAVLATQKTGVAEVTSGSSGSSNGNLLARNASQSTGSTASTRGGPSHHPQYHSEERGEDTAGGGAERSGGSASSSGVAAMVNPKPLPHHLGANNSGGGSSKSNRANGNRMT